MIKHPYLLGTIAGDTIGSIYEFNPTKDYDLFLINNNMEYTDDSILSIAVAEWLMDDSSHSKEKLIERLQYWARKYRDPMGSYGNMFYQWIFSENPEPYNSWGNGSAMRVSAVGFAFDTMEETRKVARISAEITHNHPEGIKGAEATAAAIFMARKGNTKEEIRKYITTEFGYPLDFTYHDIHASYGFEASCQQTVPQSIVAFLDSKDYEDAIRMTISLGGDADTMGAITGAIAFAYYKEMPTEMGKFVLSKLPDDLKAVVERFDVYVDQNLAV